MIRQIYRKYQNRERYKEIIRILARHGFHYLLQGRRFDQYFYWITKVLPAAAKPLEATGLSTPVSLPARVRLLFEDLGPTFIKLGQLLSTRPDLVPQEYASEFGKLQDHVEKFGPTEVKEQFLDEFGVVPEELFARFDYIPLASASIAQAYQACLPNGQKVVVKVQRPGLKHLIEKDLAIMRDWADTVERSIVGKVCNVHEVIEVFSRQIRRELDFTVEGLNTEAFRALLAHHPRVEVPKIYWDYSSKEILTMDFMEGKKADMIEKSCRGTPLGRAYARSLLEAILIPMFNRGIFHGDPHPGNVLFQDDGSVVLLDFGIVGRLDDDFRYYSAQLMLALSEKNVAETVEITTKIGIVTREINYQYLYEDLAHLMDRATGIHLPGIDFSQLIRGMIEISLNHGIKMPGSFFTLGKALIAAEGLAKRLDPEINLVEVARPIALAYLRGQLQPCFNSDTFYQRTSATLKTLSELPRDIAKTIQNLANGDLTTIFVHRGLESLYDMLDIFSTRLAVSLLVVAMMIGSALVIHAGKGPFLFNYPAIGLLGFLTSAMMGIWMIFGMLRHGKLK
ncbi:ABC1 kinase family protein [Calderihabitans maritimus]|uniref:ABC transporter n=1 Tax=Calderihabitans maritimus TaxID=1246530 RepID=A0A1Z5HWH8_9FIRM|nr:AarF/UbiB family protein [Calderihabitans maritimus]GAW93768.1 ABC transporter [Calderihabitans maritimus]